jgi:hypothetical protein
MVRILPRLFHLKIKQLLRSTRNQEKIFLNLSNDEYGNLPDKFSDVQQ